jgi:hypothetical protein
VILLINLVIIYIFKPFLNEPSESEDDDSSDGEPVNAAGAEVVVDCDQFFPSSVIIADDHHVMIYVYYF